jgi:hypothetical protein
MSDLGAALGAAFPSSARAEASRINGARSCGPKTPEGKARASQNALKHGLRAQKFVVVGDEKAAEFLALEAALSEELAPDGALQGLLAARIARAAWRLERAERIEAELFARHAGRDRNLGLAMIRDGNGTRAFDALLRYRGTALAELWRALRLLKALQAEAAREVGAPALVPTVLPAPHLDITGEKPIEPEARASRRNRACASGRRTRDCGRARRRCQRPPRRRAGDWSSGMPTGAAREPFGVPRESDRTRRSQES